MKTKKELVEFLKKRNVNAGFLDKIKIVYRPYICPFEELLDLVPENSKVFDVGCGSGQFALLIAEFTNAKAIHGIEISEKLINNAKKLLEDYKERDIDFSVYDGVTFPDKISDYDVIFLIDVLHHVPKNHQITFLKTLWSKLKSGAKLVIKDIDAGSVFVYFNKLHDLFLAGEIGNEVRPEILASIFSDGKTSTIKRKREAVYAHYTIVIEK